MKGLGEEALEFVNTLKECYFIKRDAETLLSYMLPEVSCMGTGKHEIFHTVEEVRSVLEREKAEYAGSFSIEKEALKAEVLSKEICCVYGIVEAKPQDETLAPFFVHVTLICQKKKQGFRLLHCNFSQIDSALQEGRFMAPSSNGVDNQNLQKQMTDHEKQRKDLLNNIPGGAHRCAADAYFTVMNMSDQFISLFGFTKEEIQQQFDGRFINMIHPEDRDSVLAICKNLSENIHAEDRKYFVLIMEKVKSGVPYAQAEFRIRNTEGVYRWHRIRATTQFDKSGESVKAVGVIFDIDDSKQEKQELLEMAQKDALTGLNNKQALKTKVNQIIQMKNKQRNHALLIIDIDNFKNVNDTYGHLCGDRVLSDVAATLRGFFRTTDIIGRIGGDEFLVFLTDIEDKNIVVKKAEQVLRELHKIRPDGGAEHLCCSIGAAISFLGGDDYLTLYHSADTALYQQKKNGKDGVALFDAEKTVCAVNEKCTAVGDEITAGYDGIENDRLSRYIFRTLYQVKNWREDISPILEIVGRALDISRVYIIEITNDGKRIENTYEWFADEKVERQEKHRKIGYEIELSHYPQCFNEQGIIWCDNIEKLPEKIKQISKDNQAHMFLQCTIMEGDKLRGLLGFDDCKPNRVWTKEQRAVMELTATALATFISKFQMEEKIAKYNL